MVTTLPTQTSQDRWLFSSILTPGLFSNTEEKVSLEVRASESECKPVLHTHCAREMREEGDEGSALKDGAERPPSIVS